MLILHHISWIWESLILRLSLFSLQPLSVIRFYTENDLCWCREKADSVFAKCLVSAGKISHGLLSPLPLTTCIISPSLQSWQARLLGWLILPVWQDLESPRWWASSHSCDGFLDLWCEVGRPTLTLTVGGTIPGAEVLAGSKRRKQTGLNTGLTLSPTSDKTPTSTSSSCHALPWWTASQPPNLSQNEPFPLSCFIKYFVSPCAPCQEGVEPDCQG